MGKFIYGIIAVLSVVSVVVVVEFYPVYIEEFLLFIDISTIFLFMPAYCFLTCITIPVILSLVVKSRAILIWLIVVQFVLSIALAIEALHFYALLGKLLALTAGMVPTVLIGAVLLNIAMLTKQKQFNEDEYA